MSFIESAFRAAVNAPENHNLKVGDKVQILNPDYRSVDGEVAGFHKNLLGKTLVEVIADYGDDGKCSGLVFYSNELVKKVNDG